MVGSLNPDWLRGEGEMVRRFAAHDWAATPLGPLERWPQSLRSAVQLMLASAQPAYIGWGPDLLSLYNDGYIPIAGEKHPAALGLPYRLMWPEVSDEYRPLIEAVMAGGSRVFVDQPVALARRPGRPMSWFSFSWTPLRDEGGNVAGIFCSALETTDRVLAQEARDGNYRTLFDAMSDGFCIIERLPGEPANYLYLAVNPAFERQTGLHDPVGRTLRELLPGIEESIIACYEEVRLTGRPGGFERHVTDLGRWFEAQATPADRPGRIAVLFRDVTDRKRAEQALRDSEDLLRTVLGGIQEPFYALDADCRFLFASRSALAVWGMQAEEVLGHRFLQAFPQAAGSDTFDAHLRVMRTGMPERLETLSPVSGRWFEIDLASTPDGGLSVSFRNIDARKQAERHQAFLLRLSDAVRPLTDAARIEQITVDMLGKELGANRVFYATISDDGERWSVQRDYADGLPGGAGEFPMSEFQRRRLPDWRMGKASSVADCETDPALNEADRAAYRAFDTRAAIGVPLVRHGRFAALLAVNHAQPRQWTQAELALTRETAERTWVAVEQARIETALRDSEVRQSFLLKLSDTLRLLDDPDAVAAAACRMLVEELGASRAQYSVLVDDTPGAEVAEVRGEFVRSGRQMARRYPLNAFGTQLVDLIRSGQTLSMDDIENDGRITEEERQLFRGAGSPSAIAVPRIRSGRLVATFAVHDGQPRGWTPREIALTEEVADRTWAAIERARAEAALRASEARFREFGDNSSDALWIVDIETMQLEYLNPAFERIWGESRAAVMSDLSRWAELAHPDDRDAASQAMPRLLAGQPVQTDYRIVRPDGEVRWIRDAGFPIREDGIIKRAGGIAQDVTELKHAEAAARATEARLREFGDASQDVLWIRDARTLQWQYLTPAFESIYGMSREEALAGNNFDGWLELVVPEDRPRAMANIQLVKDGEQVAFEYRIRRPSDGAIRWLRNTDFPITDDDGQVTLIGGVGHDMTGLREAELRLRALMEGIPQLVWRAVDGGHWTWASPQWTAFTGQAEVDSHDWGWLEPLHPDDRAVAREAWSHAIERGGIDVEYRLCDHRAQSYRWFQTRATPVRDEAGSIIEWLGTSTDIHDLRLLQDRQQVMVRELQHRTRNLITVVGALSSQTMRNAASLDDFDGKFSDRLAALSRVQGLLSHLSAGRRVSFDELLRSELTALGAPEDRVTLDGPEGVPLRSTMVQTFSLALHELATNALKYGALAATGGHLAVSWSVYNPDGDGEPRMLVDWHESGVAITHVGDQPRGGGYGRELIERALPYQMDADTTYQITPDGVHCTIDVPVSTAQAGADHRIEDSIA